jgi:hypothetical protein
MNINLDNNIIIGEEVNDVNIIIEELENKKINKTNKKETKIRTNKDKEKENIIIPKYNEFNMLLDKKYKLVDLKNIAKFYKLKQTGTKEELKIKIYEYLYKSFFIIKIQKVLRGYFVKKYMTLHGPASKNRNLCMNDTDFYTMDELNLLSFHEFVSYEDNDSFIYGFNIMSMYNLIYKSKQRNIIKNPYNRNMIPNEIIQDFKSLFRLIRIINIGVSLELPNNENNENNERKEENTEIYIRNKALNVFNFMDELGNYTDHTWFVSLSKEQLKRFVIELNNIWNVRIGISRQTKIDICPPYGNPFNPIINILRNYETFNVLTLNKIRIYVLEMLERMLYNGINNDSKKLASIYILGALTIINRDAANAMPWLYDSFI